MFENLTNKFEGILDTFKKAPSLNEKQVDEGLKLIRQALLEADVSLEVVKDFVTKVKPKLLGKEIIRSTAPGQMVVKIVHDELVSFLGDSNQEINLKSNPPVTIMMVGLQGSGKTTTTAKLSKFLEKNNKKKIMMVSLDIYRPAAQEQLKILGDQNNIQTLPVIKDQIPADICRRALSAANLNGSDVIIFDTAGRTQIDLQMMSEIKQIEEVIKPTETILVADSLTGQVAASVAKEFSNTVKVTGIILTRADGDGRGGAALSMKHIANVPIKFLGIGEKIENFESFHPDRIANRILGMGDIVSLVEKAADEIDEEKLKETEESLRKGQFSLEDYLSQLRQMKKMGGLEGVMSFLPGVSKIKSQMDQAGVDEKIITQNEEKKERVGLQSERIKYWLSQGAKPTTRVARLLGENNLMEMPKPGNNPNKAIPKKDRKKDASEAPKEEKKAEAPKEEKKAEAPKEEKKAEAPKEEKKK